MTQSTPTQRRIGTGIHVLTASGAVAGLFALQRVYDGHVRAALVWLIVCQVLDGIDGPIARRYDVSLHADHIDGHVLDLVVDFVTCVVVPTAILLKLHMVADHYATVVAGAILLTSALWFAKTDQETDDSWFNGFPAMWNIVIPSLLILGSSSRTVFIVSMAFCFLQLTDIQFPHIVKAPAMRRMTVAVTVVYFGCFIVLSVRYPDGPSWARSVLLVAPVYLLLLVLWRALAPHRRILGRSVVS